jgi:hypothetical protein
MHEVSSGCGADEQRVHTNLALTSIHRTGKKSMNSPFLGVPWFVWGMLCLVVALIFTLVWPRGKRPGKARALQSLILRWFHALVWVLLAVSFSLRGGMILDGSGTANVLALLALVVYLIFIRTVLISSR